MMSREGQFKVLVAFKNSRFLFVQLWTLYEVLLFSCEHVSSGSLDLFSSRSVILAVKIAGYSLSQNFLVVSLDTNRPTDQLINNPIF